MTLGIFIFLIVGIETFTFIDALNFTAYSFSIFSQYF